MQWLRCDFVHSHLRKLMNWMRLAWMVVVVAWIRMGKETVEKGGEIGM